MGQPDLRAQGTLVLNEVGVGGGEFFEMVVVGAPCNTVDIRGWILDDNNGSFGCGPVAGIGIAQGCVRFSPTEPAFANVPVGTILTVTPGGLADLDATCDFSMTVPMESPFFEESLVSPFASNGGTACDNRDCTSNTGNSAYPPAGSFGPIGGTSPFGSSVQLRGGGDAAQVLRPNGGLASGLSFGTPDDAGCPVGADYTLDAGGLYFPNVTAGYAFINTNSDDPTDVTSWTDAGGNSAGSPNSC